MIIFEVGRIYVVCINYMEHGPWKADSHSASVKITYLLWNMKVHYVFTQSRHWTVQSQLNSVHTLTSYIIKIIFNIITKSLGVFWSELSITTNEFSLYALPHPCFIYCTVGIVQIWLNTLCLTLYVL